MENMKWYGTSQVMTAKHVSYPQLTATENVSDLDFDFLFIFFFDFCENYHLSNYVAKEDI